MQSAFGVKFVDSKEISEWGGALTFSNNWWKTIKNYFGVFFLIFIFNFKFFFLLFDVLLSKKNNKILF
jgi:hypothetical protein